MDSSIDPSDETQPTDDEQFRPEREQDDFEIEFFGDILKRNEQNGDVMRRQAELFARRGNYPEALLLDQKLTVLYPTDSLAWYNLACSLALVGQTRQAITALSRTIDLGYADFAHIEVDSDLDALREEPSFQELLRRREIPGPGKQRKD